MPVRRLLLATLLASCTPPGFTVLPPCEGRPIPTVNAGPDPLRPRTRPTPEPVEPARERSCLPRELLLQGAPRAGSRTAPHLAQAIELNLPPPVREVNPWLEM